MTSVLDIENLCVVSPDETPTTLLECDVLVSGGGTGGVAAAQALIQRGFSVIVTEQTRSLGGQFTSQLVPAPDESSFIERDPGQSTKAYRDLRRDIRAYYASRLDVLSEAAANVGGCWVSRVSGTPDVWETALRNRLSGAQAILTRHRVFQTETKNGRFHSADAVNLDTGSVTRIQARFLIDATEDGSAMEYAGLPTVLGQESQAMYGEPSAPDTDHPEWIQSFTYCFLVRWAAPGEPLARVTAPEEYEAFRALGEYTLDYVYSDPPRTVAYKVLETAPGAAGPFWTYRRLLAASSFVGGQSPVGDVALINWRGNDFNDETYLGKPAEEQARILKRGKEFAQGFLYWLQTECPRDDGFGFGYPEMQLVTGADIHGIGMDGFALHPYVRESHRLSDAVFPLTQQHLIEGLTEGASWGVEFPDSVGCAIYAIDIHPAKGEPHRLSRALPYHIPLGAFLTKSGPVNVLPGAKNFGASRLALASARMHPTEWLIGEVAGTLAAFCLAHSIDEPIAVRNSPQLLAALQSNLRTAGIPLYWGEVSVI